MANIGVPSPIQVRVHELIEIYQSIVAAPLLTAFLSDEVDEDGNRAFQALTIFTDGALYEAKIAREGGEEFDGTQLRGRAFHWVVKATDDALFNPTAASRMKVEIWFSDGLWGDLRATGANCSRLTQILRAHIAQLVDETPAGQEAHGG